MSLQNIVQSTKLLFTFMLFFGLFGANGAFGQNVAVTQISLLVKSKVKHVTSEQMVGLMKKQLIHMRLMNKNFSWRHKRFTDPRIQNELIPNNMDKENVYKFIDQIAAAANQNEYLMSFLNQARKETFPNVKKGISEQADVVFPELIAYAIVLDRLTGLLKRDWTLIEICKDIWARARSSERLWERIKDREGFFKYQFELAKLNGVEPILDRYIQVNKSQYVAPDFMKKSLPENILMAVLLDETKFNHDNATAGMILAYEGPEYATLSNDKKAVSLKFANSEKWADLYQTWNLAFVTVFPSFPFVMTKLLIPQVANHYGHSSEYLYSRVIALNAQLNYSLLGKLDGDSFIPNTMNWTDKGLTDLWGFMNAMSAGSYQYSY